MKKLMLGNEAIARGIYEADVTVAYTGINAGLVILVADDPGMHSSQNEQDTRMIARAAHVPLLEPSDSTECKEFIKKSNGN